MSLRTKPDTGTALPLHTTFADLTRTLQKFAEPRIVDLSAFIRSHPDGPSNFRWMLTAAHVGDIETISIVKTRLTNSLPRWEAAKRKGHWSALAHPARISAAKTILNFIEEYEGTK